MASGPSLATVREVVETLAPPGTPVTTAEVAGEFDCTVRTTYNKLDALVEEGWLETKKVGARGRVWWRPPPNAHDRPGNDSTRGSDRDDVDGPDGSGSDRDDVDGPDGSGSVASDGDAAYGTEAAGRRLAEERDMFADGPVVVFRWKPDETAGWPVEFVTENVETLFGYTPEELESGAVPYTDLLLEEELDRIAREVTEHTESNAQRFSHEPYRVITKSGEIKWVKDVTKIIRDDTGAVVNYLGYLTDITERKRVEEELTRTNEALQRLNTASRELMDADANAFARRALATTRTVLDVDHAAVWQYDTDTGELTQALVDTAPGADPDTVRCFDGVEDSVWQTFLGTEVTVVQGSDAEDPTSSLENIVLVPLGRHGVICAGYTEPGRFDERTLDLVETLGATIEAAWDRAAGQRRLADRNEQLQRLDRLNSLIREIDQALVEATSLGAIDEAVCDRLAASEQYEFAWIGEHNPATGRIVPRESAGVDSGYLETLEIEIDGVGTDPDPIAAAVESRELQVVEDVALDPRTAAWREATLDRGGRSCIAIPLTYAETLYGVLVVYASDPLSDERDHAVLAELGETIAHAIDAAETRQTLLTGAVTELTFELRRSEALLATLARTAGGEIEFDGLAPRSDDESRLFVTARDVAGGDVLDAARALPAVETVDLLREDEDSCAIEAIVSGPTIASRVIDSRGAVRSITATAELVTVVVDVPPTVSIREFVESLRAAYPETELVARRSRDRAIADQQDLRAALSERLTARQHEILETAYRSGFFESPRVKTGAELSERLEITQSTFSYHLREAQRRVFSLLFATV